MTTISPLLTSSEQSVSTCLVPYHLEIFWIEIMLKPYHACAQRVILLLLHPMKSILRAIAVFFLSGSAHAGKTLDAVRERGQLACGISTGVAGFSASDSK